MLCVCRYLTTVPQEREKMQQQSLLGKTTQQLCVHKPIYTRSSIKAAEYKWGSIS